MPATAVYMQSSFLRRSTPTYNLLYTCECTLVLLSVCHFYLYSVLVRDPESVERDISSMSVSEGFEEMVKIAHMLQILKRNEQQPNRKLYKYKRSSLMPHLRSLRGLVEKG